MPHHFSLLFLLAISYPGIGQHVFEIRPSETNPQIENVHGSHVVTQPIMVSVRNRLVVSIPGTGSPAEGMETFDSVAAQMGYHVISLDYKNNVITTVCRPSTDSLCFNKFRQEIVFGTPVSDSVQVDSVNSIYSRLYNLLLLLAKRYPKSGWTQFIKKGTINWSVVTTVGHSQGAGHAAFLAKHFKLDRAIMLAGPQDFMDPYGIPAPWIRNGGNTPPHRYFALLHHDDPYGFQKQAACDHFLTAGDVLMLEPAMNSRKKFSSTAQIFVISVKADDAHGSVMMRDQAEVWRWMLSH